MHRQNFDALPFIQVAIDNCLFFPHFAASHSASNTPVGVEEGNGAFAGLGLLCKEQRSNGEDRERHKQRNSSEGIACHYRRRHDQAEDRHCGNRGTGY